MRINIIVLINFFVCCLLSSPITYIYKPMDKKTIDFGEDVCRYEEIIDTYHWIYVKPCQEGKKCESLGISNYNLYACVPSDTEYDNRNNNCVTEDNLDAYIYGNGIDCTGYSCENDKCGGTCTESQFTDELDNHKCVEDSGICKEYDSNNALIKSYSHVLNKKCVKLDLQTSDNGIYHPKKIYSNDFASIEDGEFIEDDDENLIYCSSGYALFFYGNKKLNNPNTDSSTNHKMYLMCVTVLGRDSKGIIKYSIGGGDEMYYDEHKLPYKEATTNRYGLYYNDEFLMLRLEMFNNFKNSLNDPNESLKWKYFYENPKEYLLYKNEPQIIEYLVKEEGGNYDYKPKQSSSMINIKYLALLSLILLF